MKNIILVTHAEFAKGIITSADLILGTKESIKYVGISEKETVNDAVKAIGDILTTFPEKSPALIITDIAGGSTTQAAIRVMGNRENTYVITGLNLGMLLELLCMDIKDETGEETFREILSDIVNNSREAIQLVNDLSPGNGKNTDEDSGEL